jgi:RNA polymerase sigma-70 factor (ECF subfamily)
MIASSLAVVGVAEAQPDASERLGRLFDAHHARLYRLARRMVSSTEEARDAVQETFLRAAKYSRSMPAGASSEEAWLVRILINICRDTWRKEAVRRRTPLEPAATFAGGSEAALVARATIWRALESLSPRRRAIIVLYELEGLPIPGIARLLGITSVTVRWHLSVGRRELARVVGSGQ